MKLAERFWAKVDIRGPDQCWPWRHYTNNRGGYGVISVDDKHKLAHRVAWEIANGCVPADVCVCHRCDNPPCCNPAHLFLGTHADNVADRDAKDRQAWGIDLPQAKLTRGRVLMIRAMWASATYAQQELGAIFGVSRALVSLIVNRKRWKHLEHCYE